METYEEKIIRKAVERYSVKRFSPPADSTIKRAAEFLAETGTSIYDRVEEVGRIIEISWYFPMSQISMYARFGGKRAVIYEMVAANGLPITYLDQESFIKVLIHQLDIEKIVSEHGKSRP